MKTFYKVVTCEATGKLTSSAMKPESGLQVSYKFNEFVQPPAEALELGYGLCVFDDLEAAKTYAECYRDRKIFTCDVELLENPRQYRLWICDAQLRFLSETNTFNYASWPKHTILAKAVKLVEEVL